MTELVICSGKGGTGKTSVVAALADLAEEPVLADCDVDASNLHLVLEPVRERSTPFVAGCEAAIRPDDCTGCGTCRDLCRFDAISCRAAAGGGTVCAVDPLACEGCGVCVAFCAADAIDFTPRRCGTWHLSRTDRGPLVHARLDAGAENSGKLVTLVREQARLVAARAGRDLILVDGPPGIGCPVSAALTGADLALLVTEPSLSGLHDLRRIVDLAARFEVPVAVCLNKHDLSPELTGRVEDYCRREALPLLGRIPFEPLVNEAQAAGRSLIQFAPHSAAARALRGLWHGLERRLSNLPLAKG